MRRKDSDKQDDISYIQREYMKLDTKLQALYESAVELRQQNQRLVTENKTKLIASMEFRFLIIERIKMGLLIFNIQTRFYNPDIHSNTLSMLCQQNYINPPLTCQELGNPLTSVRLPDFLRRHVKANIISPGFSSNFIQRLLRVVLRHINARQFNLPQDRFGNAVIAYVVRNEESELLRRSPSFFVLEEIKRAIEQQLGIILGQVYATPLLGLLEDYFKSREIEVIVNQEANQESFTDDSFSMRSLRGSLNVVDRELIDVLTNFWED